MDLTGYLPDFGNIGFTVAAFVVALSVVVAVHEYGHYIVGRWSGIHAEVFSLGFGPTLWSRVDRRGTRWQVAALPLGGYVKFLGDSDAASGRDGEAIGAMAAAERRRTMHGAPLWARASTVAAGPVFNFLLSTLIFAAYFAVSGVATDEPIVGRMKPLPGPEAAALQPGDRIVAIEGTATPDLAAFLTAAEALPPAPTAAYRVLRDGAEVEVSGPYPLPPAVDSVTPQSAAMAVGMAAGDVVVAVDGTPVHAFAELRAIAGASEGRVLLLTVWRAGETLEVAVAPRRMDLPLPEGGFETRWLIGLSGGLAFEPATRTPGALETVGAALSETWRIVTTSLSGIGHILTGQISTCNLQGPVGIAETSGAAASQGAQSFILFVALLSTAVGLLNLFPIPVLDGGHLVFHAWEAVTGRPPSDRALRVAMSMGLALLLSLMVFALGNDLIFC